MCLFLAPPCYPSMHTCPDLSPGTHVKLRELRAGRAPHALLRGPDTQRTTCAVHYEQHHLVSARSAVRVALIPHDIVHAGRLPFMHKLPDPLSGQIVDPKRDNTRPGGTIVYLDSIGEASHTHFAANAPPLQRSRGYSLSLRWLLTRIPAHVATAVDSLDSEVCGRVRHNRIRVHSAYSHGIGVRARAPSPEHSVCGDVAFAVWRPC
jgi:hypothetical protein